MPKSSTPGTTPSYTIVSVGYAMLRLSITVIGVEVKVELASDWKRKVTTWRPAAGICLGAPSGASA